MKNLIHSLKSRFRREEKEPLGELLWVRNASTIVPWRPRFDQPPAMRPHGAPRIEIGCVVKTMRILDAQARELQEVQAAYVPPVQAPVIAPVRAASPRHSGPGYMMVGAMCLYVVLINLI